MARDLCDLVPQLVDSWGALMGVVEGVRDASELCERLVGLPSNAESDRSLSMLVNVTEELYSEDEQDDPYDGGDASVAGRPLGGARRVPRPPSACRSSKTPSPTPHNALPCFSLV